MRRLIAAALIASAAGCTWSDLDAEFLSAMPQRAELKVRPPTQGAQPQALVSGLGVRRDEIQSDAFLNLNGTAENLNGLIDGLTGGLDLVRQLPPSQREPDRRVWGPYADKDHPGFDIQVVIARDSGGYTYTVEWRRQGGSGSFVAAITGSFEGERASGGAGEFVLDLALARQVGIESPDKPGTKDLSRLVLTYDRRSELTQVWLSAVPVSGEETLFHHLRRADGSGEMTYDAVLDDGLQIFQLVVNARWLASRAGRIDAVGTSANNPLFGVTVAECWDESLELVYHQQDPCSGEGCLTGTKSACRL